MTTREQVEAEKAAQLVRWLANDYKRVRALPDGTVIAIGELLTTRALYVGMSFMGWEQRYCFDPREGADRAFDAMRTGDDEVTGFIARRPEV